MNKHEKQQSSTNNIHATKQKKIKRDGKRKRKANKKNNQNVINVAIANQTLANKNQTTPNNNKTVTIPNSTQNIDLLSMVNNNSIVIPTNSNLNVFCDPNSNSAKLPHGSIIVSGSHSTCNPIHSNPVSPHTSNASESSSEYIQCQIEPGLYQNQSVDRSTNSNPPAKNQVDSYTNSNVTYNNPLSVQNVTSQQGINNMRKTLPFIKPSPKASITTKLVIMYKNLLPLTYLQIENVAWVGNIITNRPRWNNKTVVLFTIWVICNRVTIDIYTNRSFVQLMDLYIFNGMTDNDYYTFDRDVKLLKTENNKYHDAHGLVLLQHAVMSLSLVHCDSHTSEDALFSFLGLASALVEMLSRNPCQKETELARFNQLQWPVNIDETQRAHVYRHVVTVMDETGRISKSSSILPVILKFTDEQCQLIQEYKAVGLSENVAVFCVCETPIIDLANPDLFSGNLRTLEKLCEFLVKWNIKHPRFLEFVYNLPEYYLQSYYFIGPRNYINNTNFDVECEIVRYESCHGNNIQADPELLDSKSDNG